MEGLKKYTRHYLLNVDDEGNQKCKFCGITIFNASEFGYSGSKNYTSPWPEGAIYILDGDGTPPSSTTEIPPYSYYAYCAVMHPPVFTAPPQKWY